MKFPGIGSRELYIIGTSHRPEIESVMNMFQGEDPGSKASGVMSDQTPGWRNVPLA